MRSRECAIAGEAWEGGCRLLYRPFPHFGRTCGQAGMPVQAERTVTIWAAAAVSPGTGASLRALRIHSASPRCDVTKTCYVAAKIQQDLSNKDYELAYLCTELRRSAFLALGRQQQ